VVAARLVKENDVATIVNVDTGQRTVAIVGKRAGSFTVRLAPEEIRQIRVGEEVDLEIAYTAEGKRKLQLIHRQPRAEQPRSEKGQTGAARQDIPPQGVARQSTQPPGSKAQKDSPPSNHPPSERIEAETFGLDTLMLEQVKRAGHRYEIVAFLEKHARDGLIEWYDLKQGRAARMRQPARSLHPQVQQAINSAMPEFRGFFQHQAKALDAIRQDCNLVIVTQTASGKTLSYNPAIFEYLLENPRGHVLYIFPLNALMMDQLEKIHEMTQALGKQGVKVTAAHMVGGMDRDERKAIALSCPNIVVTNPEMLNLLLDQANGDWRGFFTDLKLIVIDEVHSYRGIFGVHMTGIVRRLLITARRLGSDPRFVISSATVNNPRDLAARLTAIPESDFVLLDPDEDGSQQADKHWLVLNPDWGARNGGRYNNYQEVAADVFVEMLISKDAAGRPSPLNTILFCRSMSEVRAIKALVYQRLDQKAPRLKGKVISYISANLTNKVKRDIYDGLRNGDLLGVISTNALEAGIDIGKIGRAHV
jgi:DEAD/DEAH box helicase domain-containing protein